MMKLRDGAASVMELRVLWSGRLYMSRVISFKGRYCIYTVWMIGVWIWIIWGLNIGYARQDKKTDGARIALRN